MRNTYIRTPEIREKMRRAANRFYEKRRKQGLGSPVKGRAMSKENKEKIRQAMLLFNQRIRDSGKPHPLQGRSVSEEQKQKQRIAMKGRYSGPNNPAWRGGRKKTLGYIFVWQPHHPKANPDGYVQEHRLIVEKALNRFLKAREVVHHANGKTDDNRLENLIVFKGSGVHSQFHKGKPIPAGAIVFDGRKRRHQLPHEASSMRKM